MRSMLGNGATAPRGHKFGGAQTRGGCCGAANLTQLLVVTAVVVLLAGVHNVWVAHLIARCFRLAGRIAEGTKSGAVGMFVRSSGAGAGGAPGGLLSRFGGSFGRGLAPNAPIVASAGRNKEQQQQQTSEGALDGSKLNGNSNSANSAGLNNVHVTTLSAEHALEAVPAAQRLLSLLNPDTRQLLAAVAGEGEDTMQHGSSDVYTREYAAALARSIIAATKTHQQKKAMPADEAKKASDGTEEGAHAGRAGSAVASDGEEDLAAAVAGADAVAEAKNAPPPAADPAASLPYPYSDERYHSQQTCYMQSDESEICVYDGVICTDGVNAFVSQDRVSDLAHEQPEATEALAAALNSGAEADANGRWLKRIINAALASGSADGATAGIELLGQFVEAFASQQDTTAAAGSEDQGSFTPAETLLGRILVAVSCAALTKW